MIQILSVIVTGLLFFSFLAYDPKFTAIALGTLVILYLIGRKGKKHK